MKTIHILTAALLLAGHAFAQGPDPVTPKPVTNEDVKVLPSLTVLELVARSHEFTGKLVRLRFAYRGAELRGGIGELYEARKTDIALVSVVVPEKGTGWYQRMQYGAGDIGDRMPPTNKAVIVRVLGKPADPSAVEKAQGGGLRVEAFGREVKAGSRGPEFVW